MRRVRGRVLLIAGLALLATVATLCTPRFNDPPWVWTFADTRSILGVPNFMDVMSNAPWAVLGALGLLAVRRCHFIEAWERPAWAVLFAAVGLVAAGSAYFHLAPSPATLVWDRLPMAVVFMAVFALTIAERIDMRAGRILLPVLIAAGIASVLYWSETGDVRFYYLVQGFPLLAMLIMLLLFPPRYTRAADLAAAIGWYALAKVFELFDAAIFAATGAISGHTLKHLAGATATLWLFRMVRLRRPVQKSLDSRRKWV